MTPNEPVIIVAVYAQYQRWLGPFLESALATGHRDFVIVTDGGNLADAERLMTWAFEGSTVQHTAVEESADYQQMIKEPTLRTMAYLAAWRRALRLLPVGQRFACAHVDSLVQRPLVECWRPDQVNIQPFGLAAQTTRFGPRWTFDLSLVCGQAAPLVLTELDTVLREAIRFSQGAQKESIARMYGTFGSAAMATALARSMDGSGTIIAQFKMGTVGGAEASTLVHFGGVLPSEDTPIGRRWRALGEAYAERKGVAA